MTKKDWITLGVPSAVAIGTGFKAELIEPLRLFWNGVTPWRFLFAGSVVWIGAVLLKRFVRKRDRRLNQFVESFWQKCDELSRRIETLEKQ